MEGRSGQSGVRQWGKALPLRSFLRGFYGHDLSREYASSLDAEKTRESRGKRLVEKIPACGLGLAASGNVSDAALGVGRIRR